MKNIKLLPAHMEHKTPEVLQFMSYYGFEDVSYGNDACASFMNEDIQIFTDAEQRHDREYEGADRFQVILYDDFIEYPERELFTCETLEELAKFMEVLQGDCTIEDLRNFRL